LAELGRAIAGAELLARFWLREGYPADPVFWDFAFVLAGPGCGLVFLGSSSDRGGKRLWRGRGRDLPAGTGRG
jgi:hypothetical protein